MITLQFTKEVLCGLPSSKFLKVQAIEDGVLRNNNPEMLTDDVNQVAIGLIPK